MSTETTPSTPDTIPLCQIPNVLTETMPWASDCDFYPTTPVLDPLSDTFVSDHARDLFQWVGYSIVCEFIDVFGTVTNIMNIACFIKLGFKESVNVSLLGLAISDLCCLATLIWTNICMNPAFNALDLPFDSIGLQYLTTGWTHANFTRVTSWITAFITLERCLCIQAPLKVKSIFTPKRVAIIISSMSLILLVSVAPVYVVNKLETVFVPARNKSLLVLTYTENRATVEQGSYAFNNVAVPFTSFAVITICTVTLVIKLRSQTKWRQMSVAMTASDKMSSRDHKVTKMVVMISVLFIACFIPVCINFIAMSAMPELSVNGRFMNTIFVFQGLGFILESTNSSLNIFIYYNMSSKFKKVLQEMFCCWSDNGK